MAQSHFRKRNICYTGFSHSVPVFREVSLAIPPRITNVISRLHPMWFIVVKKMLLAGIPKKYIHAHVCKQALIRLTFPLAKQGVLLQASRILI